MDIARINKMPIEPFLDCRNIGVSVTFYTEVLDFDLVVAPDPDPQQFGSRYAAVSRDGDILQRPGRQQTDLRSSSNLISNRKPIGSNGSFVPHCVNSPPP